MGQARNFTAGLFCFLVLGSSGLSAPFQGRWVVTDGWTAIEFDIDALRAIGVEVTIDGDDPADRSARLVLSEEGSAGLLLKTKGGVESLRGRLPLKGAFTFAGPAQSITIQNPVLRIDAGRAGAPLSIEDPDWGTGVALIEIGTNRQAFDRPGGVFLFESHHVWLSAFLAEKLGVSPEALPTLGVAYGRVDGIASRRPDSVENDMELPNPQQEQEEENVIAGGNNGTVCPRNVGPDVIVGDIPNVTNYAAFGNIEAFTIGTSSCNVGNANLQWVSNTNQHPVIGQNMFRMRNGRFEQIGQAWLKHGFLALTENICGCGCNGQGGSVLGVGCSDPYDSGLNGSQGGMGPKFQVNAFNGAFTMPWYPGPGSGGAGSVYKRVQVDTADLEQVNYASSTHFYVEAQYVSPDDSSNGNQFNNCSYRRVILNGSGTTWSMLQPDPGHPTQREKPAIRAWRIADPTVRETDIIVPSDGQMILATKVTDLGTGFFSYEYAVQNVNSDRCGGSFSIPISGDVTVQNIGFRDVPYHSGEPYDGTDWTGSVGGGAITWQTTPHNVNSNANALRWGTLYNFRFEANTPPQNVVATLGLFKPGSPTTVTAVTDGPGSSPDCNQNGIPDNCDLSCGSPGGPCDVLGCGTATDCDGNGAPDDCQPDCNNNTIADPCDLTSGFSRDCNGNGVPDDCENFPTFPIGSTRIATGFNQPVFVTAPPGDTTRLFVVEQVGRIKIINLSNNTVLATSYLDISGIITVGGERGLLSMAFDPNYSVNGRFFVNYTNQTAPGDTVIARYTVSGNPNVANPASATILKTIDQDFQNHKGGQLQFGPDGMLYVGMGDGGSANDPNGRAQDTGTLLGKMLRLDVNNAPTYVPADNPFVGPGNPLDEIWAIGMRNPWRFSFDRLTGDMYIADVGQDDREEIDFEPAGSPGGRNYGWRCMEGSLCTGNSGCTCNHPSLTLPIYQYDHTVPGAPCFSITGGYVYRGCSIPWLAGSYFFADFCLDRIWSFRYTGGSVTEFTERTSALATTSGPISSPASFGEDAAGELYIVSHNGSIYKIAPGGSNPSCGNGLLEAGEQCDDGNVIPGDGCNTLCQSESGSDLCNNAPAVCPGTYGGSTSGLANNGSSSCGISNKSPDAWYRYTPGEDGTLTVSLCGNTDYDSVVSIHSGCPGNELNEIGCDDDMCGNTRSLLSVPVTRALEYYIRVSGYDQASGDFTLSLTGPDCIVCPDILFEDHFETDLGWTVQNSVDLFDGAWQRGDPVGDGSRGDPTDDFDGGGQCYLTDNAGGNSDVDGGPTYLISPTLDLSSQDVSLTYAYWLGRDDADGDDHITVDVSTNNGTSWTPIATHTTSTNGWLTHNVLLDLFASLTATSRVRFGIKDLPNNSVVEAGIDAVVFSRPCFPDCNSNAVNDAVDISSGTSLDCNGNSVPDECDVASGTSMDCDGGPVGVIDGGDAIVSANCFACHNSDGSGGQGFPGPNIRNYSRVTIWNMLLPPTSHPGGAHPEFSPQDFANLEAFLADGGSRGRPDLVPDECQPSLLNCNSTGPSDGCELNGGTQLDANYDGSPDDCVTPICNTLTGSSVGSRYLLFSASSGTGRFPIRVDGEPGEPGVYCLNSYVQSDGTLGTSPVLHTSLGWGSVLVADSEVRPDTSYRAFADCAWGTPTLVHVETWPWGSSEPSGVVELTDLLCVLETYEGDYSLCAFEAGNLWPCVPDDVVDIGDVLQSLDAYAGQAFPCAAPCP